eukprot:5091825-Karenia_brevis.AAC.1
MAPKTWRCRACQNVNPWREWRCSSCSSEFISDGRKSGWIDYSKVGASNVDDNVKNEKNEKGDRGAGSKDGAARDAASVPMVSSMAAMIAAKKELDALRKGGALDSDDDLLDDSMDDADGAAEVTAQ